MPNSDRNTAFRPHATGLPSDINTMGRFMVFILDGCSFRVALLLYEEKGNIIALILY